ncbi:MAG: replicative DNA helicase [Defluviitaleaceae bacterium]|nr:replicative DNA helicase [Defluviitaleaceae bacterium]
MEFYEDFNQSNEKIISRVLPNDTEAEQAILGSIFFGIEPLSIAYERLKSDDFYRADHKVIFETMVELFVKNIAVDLITLTNRLDEKGLLNTIGNEYLITLYGSVSTGANIRHYIDIVEKKSILRKLISASGEISNESYSGEKDVEDIIELAEKSIFNIIENRSSDDFSPIHEVLTTAIEKIEEIYKNKGGITGVETGFTDFDRKTAGLQKSDLILIAARPSMGKTALALNIAQHAAVKKGLSTAIFSLEMSKEQLVNRLLCSEAMVDAQKLRTGSLEGTDWEKIADSIGPLSEAPLYIDDTPGITLMELRAKCRRLKLEKGLDLVLIDYLQLMSGSGSKSQANRQQEISDISRGLKGLAREMNVPVIALSQLSRAVEGRADKRPMLSDLRESGAIEQDADVVSFLYRDEYYNPDTEKKNMAEVIIAKQRNGPTGTIDLIWMGNYTKFRSVER